MAIKTNSLNRMVQLAFRGQNADPVLLDSALGVLNKCGLRVDQNAKIADILRHVPSDNAVLATTEMKGKILAILNNEAVDVTPQGLKQINYASLAEKIQILPRNQVQPMSFPEHSMEIRDISENIFEQCLSGGDIRDLQALVCTSVKLCENLTFLVGHYLKLCPGLTILDAKTQGITVDDEPCINKWTILKCFKDLAPHVENNEGLTLLTMAKGLTLSQLVKIAAKDGVTVEFQWDEILSWIGYGPVKQTYVILITNSVFRTSRYKNDALHKECVAGHGCEMPTVQEYVALCVFTKKCFKKCLYRQDPGTYGRSSSSSVYQMVVGGCTRDRLYVGSLPVHEFKGVGGRLKF